MKFIQRKVDNRGHRAAGSPCPWRRDEFDGETEMERDLRQFTELERHITPERARHYVTGDLRAESDGCAVEPRVA